VSRRRPLTHRGAKRLGERERELGLDPDDEAARWLAEHAPPEPPTTSESARKSKLLHQWRHRQQRRERPS
jgi:hypothetical protein